MSSGSSGFSNVPFNNSSSPPDEVPDALSPWTSGPFSLSNTDIDNEFSYYDDPFESDSLFVPESSTSRLQGQTRQETPPSNQQASRSRNILNSPDPFSEFIDIPSPTSNTTRASSYIDLTENPVVDLTDSPEMPTTRKRKRETTGSEAPSKKAPRQGSRTTPAKPDQKSKEVGEVVDLADIEEESQYEDLKNKQQAELIKQQNQDEATRPVRLAEFQCIICMDNPTALTVTHCGHLFCSECLHEALHAGNNEKKSCPVCRTAVNTTLGRGPDKKQPKNGFFHLEMKLMTATRKGKMPQGRT